MTGDGDGVVSATVSDGEFRFAQCVGPRKEADQRRCGIRIHVRQPVDF